MRGHLGMTSSSNFRQRHAAWPDADNHYTTARDLATYWHEQ